MFLKNFQVTVSRKDKEQRSIEEDTQPKESTDYVQLARETTETIAKYLVIGVAAYVAADTARQVIVKLTPSH